jgi:hypothetical protein
MHTQGLERDWNAERDASGLGSHIHTYQKTVESPPPDVAEIKRLLIEAEMYAGMAENAAADARLRLEQIKGLLGD